MKTTSKIFIPILCLVCLLLNSTCKQSLTKYVTYEGYVYDDSTTRKPVQGHVIILRACGGGSGDKQQSGCQCCQFELGRSTTDASGHFYIHAKASTNPNYYPLTEIPSVDAINSVNEAALSSSRLTQLYLR